MLGCTDLYRSRGGLSLAAALDGSTMESKAGGACVVFTGVEGVTCDPRSA